MPALSPRPRRSRLTMIVAGALLPSALLAGCGMEYQTDRINTIGSGTNDREGSVDILGAVVIAGQDDLGVFAATLVNNDLSEPAALDGVQQTEQVGPLDSDSTASAVEVPAGGRTSLFNEDAIAVTGDFIAGDFVDVTLQFDTGQVSTVEVPVVVPCRQYALDQLPGLELPSTDPAETVADESTESTESTEPTESTDPSENASEGSEGEDLPGPYSCESAPELDPHADSGGEPEGEAEAAE
jgi:hypothetical protein